MQEVDWTWENYIFSLVGINHHSVKSSQYSNCKDDDHCFDALDSNDLSRTCPKIYRIVVFKKL